MSELKQSYHNIMFSIPFNHLLVCMASLEPELKEKKQAKDNKGIVTEKTYKNGVKMPIINL